MGRADVRAALLKKADLIPWVEENAADLKWAPASLSWTAAPDPTIEAPTATADDLEPVTPPSESETSRSEDGAGAFEVTPEGEAALERAA